ncbi:MAG: sensor domain-containing diguanylate cyclase [Alphaproteobacteria bacterium]|nr:sensor domain-containing diguanylate cyclase [Alphaproteobacteria bacterium]
MPDTISDSRFVGNPLVTGDPKIRFYAGAPLRTKDGYNLGTLCVLDHKPRVFPGAHAKLLEKMAALVMSEFKIRLAGRSAVAELSEKEKYANELYRLATTDSLTDALNRRAFLEIVKKDIVRAKRYQRPLSVLLLDIDHFKDINDKFGHATGDAVLKALVATARSSLRVQDVLGQVGGEEFVILLPETPAVNALVLANRLREGLGSIRIEVDAASVRFTVSIGITGCLYANDTVDDALKRAELALYAAKDAGRNRVELQSAA